MFLQVADYANNKPPVDLSSFINRIAQQHSC